MFDTEKIAAILTAKEYIEDTFLEDLGAEMAASLLAASREEQSVFFEYLAEPAGQDILAFLLGIPVSELEEFLLNLAQNGSEIELPSSFYERPDHVDTDIDSTDIDADIPETL